MHVHIKGIVLLNSVGIAGCTHSPQLGVAFAGVGKYCRGMFRYKILAANSRLMKGTALRIPGGAELSAAELLEWRTDIIAYACMHLSTQHGQ